MSVKKDIFKSIGDLLTAKLKDQLPLPDLKWFDKQMGQFTSPELSYAIPLPAILMEFGEFTWTTTGQNMQKGEGTIKFYIYFENYANSFTGSLNQETALTFFEFTEAAHVVLQGYAIPGKMTALTRVADNEDTEQDMVITSLAEYSCTIFDDSSDTAKSFVDVDPDVQVEYKKYSSRPEPTSDGLFDI